MDKDNSNKAKDMDIVTFTEEILGIKLEFYQKMLLKAMYENKDKYMILPMVRRR